MISSNTFAERLQHAMKRLGFSQRDLASAIDVSQGTVSGWLNGAIPQGRSAKALAEYLAVRVDWLIGEDASHDGSTGRLDADQHGLEEASDQSALEMLDRLAREHRRQADEIDDYLRQKKFRR